MTNKMKFVPYEYELEHLDELKKLCPINRYKVVNPSQLPIDGLPSNLVTKSFRAVVCGSGDNLGFNQVYMINFIRPDEKVLAVDQEPLIIVCHNNNELTAGFIHHGNWPGRTVYPEPAFFQSITASGIDRYYPYIGIPDRTEGSILDLAPDAQRFAWWHSLEELKKPRS